VAKHQALFDAVVADHESSQHVVGVLGAAIAERESLHVTTDQGAPYLAQATREALARARAPTRKRPLGTSMVERGFGILKTSAARCSRYLIGLPRSCLPCVTRACQKPGAAGGGPAVRSPGRGSRRAFRCRATLRSR